MKTNKLLLGVVVALQAGFLLAWAGYHEVLRRTAPVVLLKVEPYDPRDIVRGQYFRLGYEINRVSGLAPGSSWSAGDTVWVGLDPGDPFWVAGGVYADRESAAAAHVHAVRGRVAYSWQGNLDRITYGIEEYYVPEGTETPDFRKLSVEATVSRAGDLHIKHVLLEGKPWP